MVSVPLSIMELELRLGVRLLTAQEIYDAAQVLLQRNERRLPAVL